MKPYYSGQVIAFSDSPGDCDEAIVTGFAKRDLIAQNKKIELLVPRDSSILEH